MYIDINQNIPHFNVTLAKTFHLYRNNPPFFNEPLKYVKRDTIWENIFVLNNCLRNDAINCTGNLAKSKTNIFIQCIFPMIKNWYEIEIVLNTFIYNFTIWVLSHFLWYINMIVAINFSKYPVNSPLSGWFSSNILNTTYSRPNTH